MLFNSGIFLKVFLPCVLFLCIGVQRYAPRLIPWVLIAVSLVFYGWWSTLFLCVLLCSAAINYGMAHLVYRKQSSAVLSAAIAINILFLAYFKYAGWLDKILENSGLFAHLPMVLSTHVVVPLAISFYTFEQISYLCDCKKQTISPANVRDYLFFILFFPKLIAGPIVRFSELREQISRACVTTSHIATGFTIFVFGLSKKLFLADQAALYVPSAFAQAHLGNAVSTPDAWIAALSYHFQIYFDFSGYSDMAIGLALMFGIRLPINFFSPYKAKSIIEFWHRWHITLSRFLRDYLYYPLGGNRLGAGRKYINLILVMLIGGLWHGAGFTFIIWGLLHGSYLAVNHWYRTKIGAVKPPFWGWFITSLAVMVAWVFFRAQDVGAALTMLKAMVGKSGAPSSWSMVSWEPIVTIVLLAMVSLFLPNISQIMNLTHDQPSTDANRFAGKIAGSWLCWTPKPVWALLLGMLFLACLGAVSQPSPFLYFQF